MADEQRELIKSIAKKTDEHEFYTPIPTGYSFGKTKYVIVTGTVMSGLGKGIFSSSLGRLLKENGLLVTAMKFDGYLNVDAGTLNPYRHGEVFVLDDGTECDMDLGTYERFLDEDLSKENYLTAGKLFSQILQKEREGKYLGRDVMFIPHVTGEIKGFVRNLALKSKADVVLIEVGGTVGDIENAYFIEAMRELAYEEGQGNCCFVTLTYIMKPSSLGEHKSKAAQLGIRALMSTGIQPHLVICRSSEEIPDKIREKISIFSNVPVQRVIGLHDQKSIYGIPSLLKESNVHKEIAQILNVKLQEEKTAWREWNGFFEKELNAKKKITVAMTGKYTGLRDSYASIINALEHAAAVNNAKAEIKWIDTTGITKENVSEHLLGVDGIIVPGGFGARGTEGKIECIRYSRENNLPYLGLCYGFQMAVIEFSRNVLKLKDANTTEIEPDTPHKVIDLLEEQRKKWGLGGNMRLGGCDVLIKKDTQAHRLYGSLKARERFRHRFECNPEYVPKLEEKGLVFSGKSSTEDIMQILELPAHKFFMGTQYHPEFTSRPTRPNPMYKGFVEACLK